MRMSISRRAQDAFWLSAATLVAAAGFVMLRLFDPNKPGNPFPKCIFKTLTGFDCIGCGVTRALHALAHGDIVRAFDMNPLAMLVLPLLPLILLDARGLLSARFKPFMSIATTPKLWLIVLPSFWILRNLPWWPFSWMASG